MMESERVQRAVDAIALRISRVPDIAVVLGSGLGSLAECLDDAIAISYNNIPTMPMSKVPGHAGNLIFGTLEGKSVVMQQGRVHMYEGYTPNDVVFGVRVCLNLGARMVVVTNAAGGIDTSFHAGELMLIEDHINLTSRNCLVGPHDPLLGERFIDMTEAYDAQFRALANDVATQLGIDLRRGVYAGLLGPSYETPAEVRMLRTLGAHAVGMSTVLEVIAARQRNARVLGISCITNAAAGVTSQVLSHHDVQDVAQKSHHAFESLVRTVIREVQL